MSEELKVGDKVTFTKTIMIGGRPSMSFRSGVIEVIELSMARVKSRGNHYDIPISRLRRICQMSELTEAVLNLG